MMTGNQLLILGSGGHGRSVAEAVLLNASSSVQLVGFVDDAFPEQQRVWDFPVLGNTTDLARYRECADSAVVAIGNNKIRASLQKRLVEAGFTLFTVVHPQAIISLRAVIGAGSAIMAGAVLGTECVLGVGSIVNCGAVVDHHCQVGDFGHLGVGTAMAGGSCLGVGAWLRAGNALGYGGVVDDWVVVG